MKNKLGARLRLARTRAKLTQAELAKKIGINATTYSNYETGFREPNLDTIMALSDILGCTVDYLVGKVDKANLELFTDLPDELKEEGITAIEVVKDAIKGGITADEISDILIYMRNLKGKNKN